MESPLAPPSHPDAAPLPSYERPPVSEVVYGIQFESIGLQCPTIGLFWHAIRNEYPKFEENPPLVSKIEKYDTEAAPENQLELLGKPPLPRVWFIDQTENWVLQVQEDRLLFNWRRVRDEDQYPRYEAVSSRFFWAWGKFLEFCRNEGLTQPVINQLELTYVNHLLLDPVEGPVKEAASVFPDLKWRQSHRFLPTPENLAWRLAFLLPDRQGRLHVSLRRATRRTDKVPFLLLELTARGLPKKIELEAIHEWFGMARAWIVRGFTDLTEEDVQKSRWRRIT